MRLALGGELVPDAVNVAGGVIDPYVRPGIPLVEKLGQIFAALAHSPLTSLDVEVHGELSGYDVSVLKLAALKGLFTNIVSETVSYVNAPLLAEQRGVEVRLLVDDVSEEYRNVITLRGALSDNSQLSVSGTLTGTKQIEKLVGINDYAIELPIEKHHVVMVYTDRPGIVAVYGQKFGEAQINIAGMQIAREAAGGQALSVLTVDSPVPEELLEEVGADIQADLFRQIEITQSWTPRHRPIGDRRMSRSSAESVRVRAISDSRARRAGRAGRRCAQHQRDERLEVIAAGDRTGDRPAVQRVVEVEAVADEHHEIEGCLITRVRTDGVLPLDRGSLAAPRSRTRGRPARAARWR